MHNKENIDNMARRYKDEMMRIYRMNCAGGHVHPAVPCDNANAAKPDTGCAEPPKNNCPPPCVPECKFVPAQDLICNEGNRPQTLPAYGTNNIPMQTDITPSMVNGKGAAGQSLVTGGVPNFDTYAADAQGMNSSGQNISVYPESMSEMNTPAEPAATTQYAGYNGQMQTADNMMSDMPADSFQGVMINPVIAAAADPSALQSDVYEEKLPDFELPPDIEVGRNIPDSISPRFIISTNWINLTGDNGWGYLQFEVTTGSLGNPVQNATVVVSRVVNNLVLLTRIVTTGYNGLTRTLVLPAPRYIYNPFRPSAMRPFAEYRASVYANGYYPVTNISIMLYAGVKSVQPVDLVPLPQYSPNPGIQPRSGS